MSNSERQEDILDILEKQGYVTVKYLTDALHYSSATINRDLNALQARGLVTRSHGGVELLKAEYVPVFFRAHRMGREKKRIGEVAASFIQDGDTIFIDGSTTAQCMEHHLSGKKGLTVITNNIVLAANLSNNDIEVVCLGGRIMEAPSMLCGPETAENASRYRVDKMFFATRAVSEDGKIDSSSYDPLLSAVAKNAKKVFYLVDHQKLGKPFNRIFCDLSSVDAVISDFDFSEDIKELYGSTEFINVFGLLC